MGRLRRAGDALLEELAKCQQPLQLRHEFFTDATTVGACVQRVLELPPAAVDGECPRSRYGTAALPAPCATQEGRNLLFPVQGGWCIMLYFSGQTRRTQWPP